MSMIRHSGLRAALLAGVAVTAVLAIAPAQARVGVTSQTTNNPLGTPPQQQQRTLKVGVDVFANERIQTTANDRAHLLFLDGSSLTVGPNSDLLIDKFVFDPNAGTGELAVSATKGIFRLVGGKITKSGEATIKVGTSTIGIRGGIAIVNAPEGQPVQAYFMFGQQMTVSTPDGSQQATRPGSLITAAVGQPPAAPVLAPANSLVGPIAQLEAPAGNAAQAAAPAAAPGALGGSPAGTPVQVEQQVASSQISAANSSADPSQVAPPDAGTSGGSQNAGGSGGAAQTADQTTGAGSATGSTPDATQPPSAPPPPAPIITISAEGRYVRAPAYTSFNNANLAAPHDPNNNVLLATATTQGSVLMVASSSGPSFTLPWHPGQTFSVSSATSSIGPVSGTGYVSPNGDFYAYRLTETTNANNPVGIFGGVLTPTSGIPTAGVGVHQAVGIGGIPFLPETGVSSAIANSSPGLLYSVYSPVLNLASAQTTSQRSNWMQASMNIQGQGAAQSSYMTVFTGSYFTDETKGDSLYAGGGGATYARNASSDVTTRYSQNVVSGETQTGSAIYGPSADYIVLTNDTINSITTTTPTTRTDSAGLIQPHNDLPSTASYYDATAFRRINTPADVGVSRTTQNMQGYAGALVETRMTDGNFVTHQMVNDMPGLVQFATNASTNRAAAGFMLADPLDPNRNLNLQFGNLNGNAGGRTTFVDDNLLAIRASATFQSQYDNGNPLNARIEMVTQAAVPDTDWLPAGVSFCSCEYLTWGYWQGDLRIDSGPRLNERDRIHLGTWVTGTLAADVDLPLSGTATYNGHIVGNVENGAAKYIAAGSFSNAWNFGSRTGAVTITNFDGANYTGTTAGSPGNVNFSGSFSGSGRTGALNGSIFRSPTDAAAYQAGSFTINGTNYKAAGTFAAQR